MMTSTRASALISEKKSRFTSKLLRWFHDNRRKYPWRRTSDPYKVLMAEFMLQRTGASQTVPVYRAFVRHYPTVQSAAAASDDRLLSVLRPLGRIGRFRQLRLVLSAINERFAGRVPTKEKLLLQSPGIGPYTARALLVFALKKRYGLFDPSIARVLARVFHIKSTKVRPHTDPEMWAAVDLLVPRSHVREFNWALLDFGALVCLPRNPSCGKCPVSSICHYFQESRVA